MHRPFPKLVNELQNKSFEQKVNNFGRWKTSFNQHCLQHELIKTLFLVGGPDSTPDLFCPSVRIRKKLEKNWVQGYLFRVLDKPNLYLGNIGNVLVGHCRK